MGVDYLIFIIWIAQAVAAAALAVYLAIRSRWFAACGTVLGLALGFLPLHLFQGPAIWAPWIHLAAAAAIVLVIVYIVTMRWKRLALALIIVGLPLAYVLFIRDSLPSTFDASLLAPAGIVGEFSVLFAPLICAITAKELFGELDRLVAFLRRA